MQDIKKQEQYNQNISEVKIIETVYALKKFLFRMLSEKEFDSKYAYMFILMIEIIKHYNLFKDEYVSLEIKPSDIDENKINFKNIKKIIDDVYNDLYQSNNDKPHIDNSIIKRQLYIRFINLIKK